MTLFRYRAARADGAMVKGRLEAASGAEAAAVLSGRGLFPLDIRVLAPSDVWPSRRPPPRALATLLRSLASLTEAGVPLQHALDATEQVTDGRLRDAVQRIARRVGEGSSLASAMQAEGTLFAPVTIGLVRAGERGVGLVTVLSALAPL
ncbi:MAG: type II secretion system F family protein, partial [Armatimonadota bacterium]